MGSFICLFGFWGGVGLFGVVFFGGGLSTVVIIALFCSERGVAIPLYTAIAQVLLYLPKHFCLDPCNFCV